VTVQFEQFARYRATIRVRRGGDWKPKEAANSLDGKRFLFVAQFPIENELYAGEWHMLVHTDDYARFCVTQSGHHPLEQVYWLASGDLCDIERVDEPSPIEVHGLDTPEQVCFYEQEFYPLSNFSSFTLIWKGRRFDTSEAAYHWEKFGEHEVLMECDAAGMPRSMVSIREMIRLAPSAHEAFKTAERFKAKRRADWDDVKVDIMRDILRAKVEQHEYVRRKLLETGLRRLVENSWRDDFWGWGPNRTGLNMLGKLWMEVRSELQAKQ